MAAIQSGVWLTVRSEKVLQGDVCDVMEQFDSIKTADEFAAFVASVSAS
jgi:hypothetical protein